MTGRGLQITVEKTRDYNEVLLVNTNDPVQLEYITDMLGEMDISFRAEEEGKDQYISLMESSDTGISIYVDESRLDEAKQLLTPLDTDSQEYYEIAEVQEHELIGEEGYDSQQKVINKYKRGFLYTILIGIGILPALGIVLLFLACVFMIIVQFLG